MSNREPASAGSHRHGTTAARSSPRSPRDQTLRTRRAYHLSPQRIHPLGCAVDERRLKWCGLLVQPGIIQEVAPRPPAPLVCSGNAVEIAGDDKVEFVRVQDKK